MVVKIDVAGLSGFGIPLEDEAPLLVDPYRMPAIKVAGQLFEMIARRHAQVSIRRGVIDQLQLPEKPRFNVCRDLSGVPVLNEELK
jgi:hypothetical protein